MKKLIIELEPFSGNSKPNLDRKVVVSIEIIEEICGNKKEALKLVGKWRNLTYCEGCESFESSNSL